MSTAATRGKLETMQIAGSTTGNGTAFAITPDVKNHTITITGTAGIGAGAIQIEAGDNPDYTGTWSAVGGGPITVVASSVLQVNFQGTFPALRARISTTVTGGSIGVTYVGS